MLSFVTDVLCASWNQLMQAAPFILFGLLIGGMLKVFLSPAYVARHLGRGRFAPVFKAALFGIPIPLCSCGVLPAAVSLKKQGANNGATAAFLISTPESGMDSIAISLALLDPIMTIARPVSAFFSAMVAGITENLFNPSQNSAQPTPEPGSSVDNCCDGNTCAPDGPSRQHSLIEKFLMGVRYGATSLWDDLAGWFLLGILLAGFITVVIPDAILFRYLGGGLFSMLLMLLAGIPIYICATASTPIAAAFILKGVSPGTALVFLLVGPATNITSLSVLFGLLGKRSTALYLASIAVVSVLCGLIVDAVYIRLGISATATVGQAAEVLPHWLMLTSTLLLLVLSIRPLTRIFGKWKGRDKGAPCCGNAETGASGGLRLQPITSLSAGCGCHGGEAMDNPARNQRAAAQSPQHRHPSAADRFRAGSGSENG